MNQQDTITKHFREAARRYALIHRSLELLDQAEQDIDDNKLDDALAAIRTARVNYFMGSKPCN